MERNERWYEIVQIILTDIARRWRSIIMCTLVFAVAADMVISLTHHPLYRSEATFALKTGNQYMTSDQIDEIADIASAYEQPAEVVEYYSKNEELMNNIRNVVLEEQAVDAVLAKAQVTEKASSFDEIMNPQA